NYDLYGKRDSKYDFLNSNNLGTISWNNLNFSPPEFSFYPVNQKVKDEYKMFLDLDSLFVTKASGIQTEFDELSLHDKKKQAIDKCNFIKNNSVEEILEFYKF